jgi:hypothetical protein
MQIFFTMQYSNCKYADNPGYGGLRKYYNFV